MSKINQEEYEVLKGLDDKWKWIARDEDGCMTCTLDGGHIVELNGTGRHKWKE